MLSLPVALGPRLHIAVHGSQGQAAARCKHQCSSAIYSRAAVGPQSESVVQTGHCSGEPRSTGIPAAPQSGEPPLEMFAAAEAGGGLKCRAGRGRTDTLRLFLNKELSGICFSEPAGGERSGSQGSNPCLKRSEPCHSSQPITQSLRRESGAGPGQGSERDRQTDGWGDRRARAGTSAFGCGNVLSL